jgi:type IV pilus assembly protein PilW
MSLLMHAPLSRARQSGVGLVELMVGILIGMIVVIVVYNVLSVAENYRRASVGTSDAQITGLLTQFIAGRDAGNGGAGITMSTGSIAVPEDLALCNKTDPIGGVLVSTLPNNNLQVALRPVPVLITDGGALGTSDTFISYSTGAPHVMWPVDFTAPLAVAGAPITVQSPNGFSAPAPTVAAPYWGVTMANDASGRCQVVKITNALPDPTIPATGKVTLTLDGTASTGMAYTLGGPARLLNLGPQGIASRIQYDVDPVNSVLRTTDLLTTGALVANPITQNIVLMKVQYGVDTDANGIVDCWTPATNTVCGNFTDAAVRNFTTTQLAQILAVRIGVVVRSDEPDLRLLTDPTNPIIQAESRAVIAATRPPLVLFNCAANNATCQSRVIVPTGAGVPAGASLCAPGVLCDYWRYRTFETVIPLRNAIYNATTPPSP